MIIATNNDKINNNKDVINVSGALPFRMTNDFLFKFLLQSDTDALKAIISAFYDIELEDIKSVTVENPITLNDNISAKEMILDIKAVMNNNTIVNLEMQVVNYHDWPERSLSYLCRCFDNLSRGAEYQDVKSAVHIGFLDYTLFPDEPEFFATYRLMNAKTGKVYSSKFQLSVVDLTKIDMATSEDVDKKRHLWAAFFKAKTWEELLMLASKDSNINGCVVKIRQLSEEEKFRQRCEAREDLLRQQRDMERYYKELFAKQREEMELQRAEIDSQKAEIDSQRVELEKYRQALQDAGINIDEV